MARQNHIPAYRLHEASGRAVVTLTDAFSGVRRDIPLGPYNTIASRTKYAEVIGEWEARGRRLEDAGPTDLTIAELLDRFLRHAETYYGKGSKEYDHFEKTTVPLTDTYPHKPSKDFGPGDLKVARQRMIDHHDWSREVVNRRVNRIRQIWKLGVEEGFVPAGAWHGLLVVKGLLAGKTTARETPERTEVPEELVARTLPFLPRHVGGLVRFQVLTGARPDEACRLRLSEVDTSGDVRLRQQVLVLGVRDEQQPEQDGHRHLVGVGQIGRRRLFEPAGVGQPLGQPGDDVVVDPLAELASQVAGEPAGVFQELGQDAGRGQGGMGEQLPQVASEVVRQQAGVDLDKCLGAIAAADADVDPDRVEPELGPLAEEDVGEPLVVSHGHRVPGPAGDGRRGPSAHPGDDRDRPPGVAGGPLGVVSRTGDGRAPAGRGRIAAPERAARTGEVPVYRPAVNLPTPDDEFAGDLPGSQRGSAVRPVGLDRLSGGLTGRRGAAMPVPRIAVGLLLVVGALGPAAPAGAGPPALPEDALGDPLPPGAVARLGTTRLRPGRPPTSLSFTPDGRRVVSAGGSSDAQVWSAVTGRLLERFRGGGC
jgi:hypothetical protein